MRVVIAGAGLAGLALAVGLARDGHDAVIWEADTSVASRAQGYRIHLDSRGLEPLRTLLAGPTYDLVEATAGAFRDPRRLEVLSGRLRHLRTIATGASTIDGRLVATAMDRSTLRAIMAAAARDAGVEIRWGTAVVGHDGMSDVVRVRDQHDQVEEADLLVGADGARSRVAAQLGSQPVVQDSGGGSIVGRSPMAAASSQLIEHLDHGYVLLRGLRAGVGLGLMRFANRPEAAGDLAGVPLPSVPDYVMWTVGVRSRSGLSPDGPEALQRQAVRRTRGWHRDVRDLIAQAEPHLTFLAPALTAERPPPRAPSRVTVIGDAAHVMPPDRGSGANLALADAARLRSALSGIDPSDQTALLVAIGTAERGLQEQAFAVIEAGPATGRS